MYEELGSVREPVALSPQEALDSAEALMTRQGYNVTGRTATSVTSVRRKREGMFGHSLRNLTVVAQPLPQGGVQIKLRGNDREGVMDRKSEWSEWGKSLPKWEETRQEREQPPQTRRTLRPRRRADESLPGAGKTTETAEGLSEGGSDPIGGDAREPGKTAGDVRGSEGGDAPAADAGGWSSATPWNQGPRVASSKRMAGQSLPQDARMDTSDKSLSNAPQQPKGKEQKEKDRDSYRALSGLLPEVLDLLEHYYAAELEHAYVLIHRPDVKESYEKARRGAYGQIKSLLESMDKLENRNPEFTTGEFASRRADLEARLHAIQRRAEEQRTAAGPPKPRPEQMHTDRENYQKLLDMFSQYLNALEEAHTVEGRSDPAVRQKFAEVLRSVSEGVEDVRSKLDILEGRNPDLITHSTTERRTRLEEQWKVLRDRNEQASGVRVQRDQTSAEDEQGRDSVPSDAETERTYAGSDEEPRTSEQAHPDNPEGQAEGPDTGTVERSQPSIGGRMSTRAAGEGDVSDRIERVESFEKRLGVRLEGLFARHSGKFVEVNGELYSREGDELGQDVEVVVTVYDGSGRVIAVEDYSYVADEFFGFEPFSILATVEGMRPAKIRIHPRAR